MSVATTQVINLDKYKDLFLDESSYRKFVGCLTASLRGDFRPIVADERMIGASLSAEAAKSVLYDRMVKHLAQRPELLTELADRLENDEIVD